ncbi:DNA-directed RNA polymerase sigma-70 factor [Paractinoplanes abujensis]|uniref:RNA polymerase sigma-70 factor (ECF subfamily) n=1 Tax=Paractinoplanes abujensis TaxID=882441 RepID=A0A7W7CV81_9ACTN|nr:sigma-70 family RNA polymerase sigma factor [Actinoplanes abujensis]MBB4693591.1 RNA polymerase sigma-70 factor (ECF subfamily) [Actinoplanes abujensis]GID21750.1 DNA-directed RNA polymerase sigma-70 factor [Actinoplanes abujensis]
MEFAAFYESARDDCLRAVTASLGSRQAAEEAVAEAFARAWARWPRVAEHPSPRAWVVRTALNLHVSWWRRWRREVPTPERFDDSGPDSPEPATLDPRMVAALRSLPLRQRQVVALRIFLDLDSRTTARTLGIAAGTVTAHLARATQALRAHLTSVTEEE